MDETLDFIVDTAKEGMQQAIDHLENELLNIRAGKANPVMLSGVKVDYYGTPTPISQVANINTPDARTLSVQPWEKALLAAIEKAILVANLGFNPMNNGETIIINIPPLTEERRRELAKLAKNEAENAKISIRNARKEANHELKNEAPSEDVLNNYEIDVQTLTDSYSSKVDELFSAKEKEILTV
ncbi:MAG: ribosome recycling factor [Flavobacteriaceae bacterium]|nr:ribosome recycling factor [Flavobacteriaceae bacterium]|tara:strand:- start:7560 stop:8114 length:555 start_codon:yes stop_codon:yes gene_type:complete